MCSTKGKQQLYGLIGYPLAHSFSPAYFTKKFSDLGLSNYAYKAFPLDSIDALPNLIAAQPNLKGFNVTIPYKEQIIPYLNNISSTAAELGAVNTVVVEQNGCLTGYNTDVFGFTKSLKDLLNEAHYHSAALILGTGGAAKAVAYGLQQLSINYNWVSRKKQSAMHMGGQCFTYTEINAAIIQQHLLIINTTPLGMYPNIASLPNLKYEAIGQAHLLYDLVYNPTETAFMRKGIDQGAQVCNGLAMLYLQAEDAWQIWQDAKK